MLLTHDGVNFPNNDAGDLAARAMVARNNNADLYVSLHINDNRDTSLNGANVYVTYREDLPKYKVGMTNLANKILNNLSNLGIRNLGVVNYLKCNDREPKYQYFDGSQADYYGDIRHCMKGDSEDYGDDFSDGSGVPAVLVEHCFINNAHDVQFLDSEEDLKKLAKADGDAIIEYLELKLPKDVVTEIKVDKENINLLEGKSAKVTATTEPSTAENKVKWTSNNEKIAKVDGSGNITAVATGIAEITVTSEINPNVSKKINVNIEKEEIKFEKEIENIIAGKTKKLSVKVTPSWEKTPNIVWKSSNEDIVEIAKDGTIIAKKAGKATVTATWEEKKLSASIEVNVIELKEEDIKIEIKDYKVEKNTISKIGPKVKIEDFLKHIEVSENLIVKVENVNEKQEDIGTNTKIIICEKESNLKIEEYNCLIYGDVNGDGKISSLDYTLIKNDIMDVKKITDEAMKQTADVNGDGKISSLDYTLIKNDIMEVKKIEIK